MFRTVITGTGSYIPTDIKTNDHFTSNTFFTEDSQLMAAAPAEIVEKLRKITGIAERRYVTDDLNTSDIAALAAKEALSDSGIDAETLDMIIVAQNFGNIDAKGNQSDAVPAVASRVKYLLGITNPRCIAYDLLFGCPGWVQGMIQADAFFKAGIARKALVIGAETLSRVIDTYDRDCMIFSDGAGAAVVEFKDEANRGILSSAALSHCTEETGYIYMDKSYAPDACAHTKYMKMKGRKVYEYALKYVPGAIKECIDNSGTPIEAVKKIFIHQANEKMDEAILQALYKLYGHRQAPANVMPMTVHYLGNSSVATVPTLYDIVLKGNDKDHTVQAGDVVVFASVGAGMNINAICYRL